MRSIEPGKLIAVARAKHAPLEETRPASRASVLVADDSISTSRFCPSHSAGSSDRSVVVRMRAVVVEDSLAARTRLVEVLDADPERRCCRPSADVLFESVAREIGPDAIACVIVAAGRVLPLDQFAPALLEWAADPRLERRPA